MSREPILQDLELTTETGEEDSMTTPGLGIQGHSDATRQDRRRRGKRPLAGT